MASTCRWCFALGSALFILSTAAFVHPEFVVLLLSGLALVALFVLLARSLVMGLLRWRKLSTFWPLPTVICLVFPWLSFYVASPTGKAITDRSFARGIGNYARVVEDFRNGSLLCAGPCNGDLKLIEVMKVPTNVRDVWGSHCDGHGVIVLFRLDTDVPLLHEGYMFKDYGEGSDCSKRFGWHDLAPAHLPFVRRISGDWYRFSDQPGF